MAAITIHANEGSYGAEICKRLASQLSLEFYEMNSILDHLLEGKTQKNLISLLQQSPKAFLTQSPLECTYSEYFEGALNDKAKSSNFLLLNFGGAQYMRSNPFTMHIKIIASPSKRCERIVTRKHISLSEAEKRLNQQDRKQQRYLNTLFGPNAEVDGTYDMILSTERVNVKTTVKIIETMYTALKTYIDLMTSQSDSPAKFTINQFPEMKNQTEIEFAHMLDMYNIDWRYEPKTFPVEWDDEGKVTMAFSPDFYLPRFKLYLELTNMNQKYVTMKNKKARLVKELYPGVNVRIVYKRDLASMMSRFEGEDSGALPIVD